MNLETENMSGDDAVREYERATTASAGSGGGALLSLATAAIADYLTADHGTRWYLLDGRLVWTGSAETLRDESAVLVARSPGLGNLDSRWWTEGLVQDDDGDYVCACEVIGDFRAVVRWACENGDVSGQIDDLVARIREAVETAGSDYFRRSVG